MVPEGHCVHEQRTLIAKGLNLTVNPPVMHQTGETDWSPRNKDRHPSHHIVSHLPELHEAMGIDARLAVYLNANHELGRQQIDVACCHDQRLVYRRDIVHICGVTVSIGVNSECALPTASAPQTLPCTRRQGWGVDDSHQLHPPPTRMRPQSAR